MIGADESFDDRTGQMFDQPAPPPSWMAGVATPTGMGEALDQAGSSPGSGMLNDPVLQKLQGQSQQMMGERKAALDPLIGGMRSQMNEPRPPVPQMEETPKAPTQAMGQGMMEFMQIATVFGALAGVLGRRGTTTSLNAFAGAIQGFAQGNAEVFKQKTEEWKNAVSQVRDTNQQKLDQYKLIWEDKKLSLDQKMEEYKLVASQYGDEIAYNLAEQRNYTMLAQANAKERQFQMKFAQDSQKLQVSVDKAHAQIDALKQKHANVNEIVDGMESGNLPPTTTGLYGEGPYVKAEAQKRNFNMAQAQMEWDAAHKQVMSQNGPQQVRYFGLASDVQRNIDRVDELAAQMQNSGIVPLNHAKLQALVQLEGNTPKGRLAARYLTAVGDLKEPFAQLANGGYAPTIPAWEQVNKQVNENFGVLELSSSLDEIKRSIGYRVNAIKSQGGLPPGSPNRYSPAQQATPAAPDAAPAPGQGGWGVPQVVQ